MKEEYDFSNSVKNPYTKKLKRQITIRIDNETINYFKELSAELNLPYQNIINLYLNDCTIHHKRLNISWK